LPSLSPPVLARAEAIADDVLLHRIYSDLLALCPLNSLHRKHLQNENWTAEEIGQFRCGSLPSSRGARQAITKDLWERYGILLAQVPGFVVKEGARSSWAEICSSGGLLLACMGWDGWIRRLRLRPDDPKPEGPKYVWLSSSRHGGPSSGSPPAFYRPNDIEAPRRLLITEGEKKAYLSVQRLALQGFEVIGVSLAGVGNHAELLPILEQYASEFDEVVIAFDQDEKEKTRERVAIHQRNLAEGLAGRGIPVLLASWRGPKGLDDLLVAGGRFSLEPYRPLAARPALVDAPEKVRAKPVPVQMIFGETLPRRKKMNVDEARVWMKSELYRIFRQDDLADQVILLKGRPGVGKSWLLTDLSNDLARRRSYQGKRLVNMTPRHDFAGKEREGWNIVTGLEYQAEGSEAVACHQLGYVRQARELGIARQEICERCPLRQACENNHARDTQAPYYLAMINSPEKRWQVNQNLLGMGRSIWLNGRLGLLTLDDVELWQVLVQERTIRWETLKEALEWCRTDAAYQPLQPLLTVLLEAGRSLDATDPHAELYERNLLERLEKISLESGMTLEEIVKQAREAKEPALFGEGKSLIEGRWSIPPRLRDRLLCHLERELVAYRKNSIEGWNRTLYVNRDGLTVYEAQPMSSAQLKGVPIVLASASMTAEQAQEFFPDRRVTVVEPDLEMPTGVRVVQFIDKSYGKTSLMQSDQDFARARKELQKVNERHVGEKVGCVTHMAAADRFKAHLPDMQFLHFYGQRGSNTLKDSRALAVMGTPCPNPESLLRQAEAFHAGDSKIHNYSVLRKHKVKVNGEELEVPYRVMGDPRLRSWLDARREQELFQAVGRARLYDTEDLKDEQGELDFGDASESVESGKKKLCTVYLYSNLPVPGVEVDEYVSDIGQRLKQQKVVTQTRIALLVKVIVQLRERGERLTQVQMVQLSGLSEKMVRRLYYAALVAAEAVQQRLKPARSEVVIIQRPEVQAVSQALPLLESRLGLPPPVSILV
jgi:hypothetical protein